jgi:DNA-binding SARP family transcriptional activator
MGALSAGSRMTLEVGLLGPLQVSVAGRPVELPTGRLPALLAVLAMSAGQTVSVDRLATAVWGEDLSVDARTNVQRNVRRLRRLLGAELVATRGGGYALEVEPDQVDALRFVRLLDLAAAAPDRGRPSGTGWSTR